MTRRRKLPKGQGSIYKRKDNLYKPWSVRGPRPQRQHIGSFKTYQEAFEALQNASRIMTASYTSTVKELFIMWQETNEYKILSNAVKERYDTDFKKLESIHKRPITSLTFNELQGIIDNLENNGYEVKEDGELVTKYYSRDTLKKTISCISKIYDTAIRNGLLEVNLAEKLIITTKDVRREKDIFSDLEIKKMFDYVENFPDLRFVLLNIYTGLRPQEMVNLTKFHIDFDRKIMHGMGVKTEAGKNKSVVIMPQIEPILRELYKECDVYILERYKKPISTRTYREGIFYPALENIGLKKRTPYACRKTFASLMSRFNVDKETIKSMMGHVKYETTSDYYIADNPDKNYLEMLKITVGK